MPHAGFVSLIGRPNAGKSTLLNRVVGAKVAIVSDKPQTTRTRIVGVKNYDDGQAVFVDTPGIHRPLHRLNVRMVDAAVETLREVDVVVLVFDASSRPGHGDEFVSGLLRDVKVPVVLALNKVDLVAKPRLLPLMAAGAVMARVRRNRAGVGGDRRRRAEQLERVLLEQLPEAAPIYPDDYLTDQPERVLVAEIVREKVLQHTRAELPFSTAVVVDQFDESEREQILRLYCTIFVETESQKPIVIGRGGEMIKRIGTDARHDLEAFFETKVFLDLRVKVDPDWREQRARARRNRRAADGAAAVQAQAVKPKSPVRWTASTCCRPPFCFASSARNAFSDRSIAARQPCGSMNAASPLPAAAAADFSGPPNADAVRREEYLARQRLLDLERVLVVRFDRWILRVVHQLRSRIHRRAAEEHDLALLSGGVLHVIVQLVSPFVWPGVRCEVRAIGPTFTTSPSFTVASTFVGGK